MMGCAPSSPSNPNQKLFFVRKKPSTDVNNNDPDEVDKVLIMESWTKLKKDRGFANIGAEIFYRILVEIPPDYRSLWRMDNIEIDDLRRHEQVENHGKLMRDELNRLLQIWSAPKHGNSQFQKNVKKLGAMHYSRLKRHRFDARVWDIFPPVLLEVMAPYCDNIPASRDKEEVLASWHRLGVYLIFLLKSGWDEAESNARTETRETTVEVEQAEDLW